MPGYCGSWWKSFPSGAWKVWDTRLFDLGETCERTYIGYTKREAQQAHAQHIRDLRARNR